jgi:hypothetical protein
MKTSRIAANLITQSFELSIFWTKTPLIIGWDDRAGNVECGGKRSATPLWYWPIGLNETKRRRRCVLSTHSKWGCLQDAI